MVMGVVECGDGGCGVWRWWLCSVVMGVVECGDGGLGCSGSVLL